MTNVVPFRPRSASPPIIPAGQPPAPRSIGPRQPSPVDFRRISDTQLQADILVLRRQVETCPGSRLSRSLLDLYDREAALRRQVEPA